MLNFDQLIRIRHLTKRSILTLLDSDNYYELIFQRLLKGMCSPSIKEDLLRHLVSIKDKAKVMKNVRKGKEVNIVRGKKINQFILFYR